MVVRFRNRFLTPTPYVYRLRNSVKFRFRFARWLRKLFLARFTVPVTAAEAATVATDAAAVLLLQHVVLVLNSF